MTDPVEPPDSPPNPQPQDEREAIFYSAVVNGWIGTRMEKDKSLLTLAAAGVGLLVTLLTAVGTRSWVEILLYALGFYGFARTAWIAIRIFDCNADYLERLANNEDITGSELKNLDKSLVRHFLIGVLAAVLVGFSAAYVRFTERGKAMAEQDDMLQGIRIHVDLDEDLGGSIHDSVSIHGSVDGFIKLKPKDPPTTSTPTTSQQGTPEKQAPKEK